YDVQVDGDPQSVSDWCILQPGVEFLEARKLGGRIRIETEDPAKAADTLARMVKDGLRITEFHREQRNLEDAFIDILGRLDSGQTAIATPPPMPGQTEPAATALQNS